MNCCSIKDYLTCLITLSTHLKPLLTHFKALLTNCSGKTFYFVYFSLGLSNLCLFFAHLPLAVELPASEHQMSLSELCAHWYRQPFQIFVQITCVVKSL